MSALTLMPKVVRVLQWYADRENYADGALNVSIDNGTRARAILAELAADGINVSAPPKVPEPHICFIESPHFKPDARTLEQIADDTARNQTPEVGS